MHVHMLVYTQQIEREGVSAVGDEIPIVDIAESIAARDIEGLFDFIRKQN